MSDPPDTAYDTLAQRLGGRLIRRWPLEGGVSADVQALELARPEGSIERVVVRRHGAATWKPLENEVTATEHDLLVCLADAGLPVPRPLLLDRSGALLPSPCMVLPFVEGTTEPSDLPRALEQMATFLARLHALDPQALALPAALPRRDDPLPELLQHLPDPLAPLAELLSRIVLEPRAPGSVLHGDFWPGNVMWRDDRLVAVIDWEDAAVGDPLSDLAGCRIELLWRHGGAAADALTTCYLSARGQPVDAGRLALWELYVGSTALASMDRWGLPQQQEAQMRADTHAFLLRAAEQVRQTWR